MQSGVVNFFDDEKGYGWFTPEGGAVDITARRIFMACERLGECEDVSFVSIWDECIGRTAANVMPSRLLLAVDEASRHYASI